MKNCIFSPKRVYRYVLWRRWTPGLLDKPEQFNFVMFIGLNPSTADETQNDPTIRKCIGFAKRWGLNAVCMTNLFAYRTKDPEVMKRWGGNPVGKQNNHWLEQMAKHASLVVAAWGNHGTFLNRDKQVVRLLGKDLRCLRYTKEGHPEHPLYVPYNSPLLPYPRIPDNNSA